MMTFPIYGKLNIFQTTNEINTCSIWMDVAPPKHGVFIGFNSYRPTYIYIYVYIYGKKNRFSYFNPKKSRFLTPQVYIYGNTKDPVGLSLDIRVLQLARIASSSNRCRRKHGHQMVATVDIGSGQASLGHGLLV